MDWMLIINGIVLPMLLKCAQKTSAEDPQAILRSGYNPTTGRMDSDLVREAMPAVRKAARKAHRDASREDRKSFPRLTEQDVYALAESSLIAGMNASAAEVTEVFASAASLGEDD